MPQRLAQLSLLALALAAATLAWSLSVDYFDSYDILGNARLLVGNGYGDYVRHRGLLSGPLYAGLAGLERIWPGFAFFRSVHLLSVTLTASLVLAFHSIAHRISPRHAWAGALAFALNPLMVHYGVFAKEDIPATLFAVLGFAEVLRAGVGAAPLWFALAGLLRPNLVPAIALTLAVYRWGQRERRGRIRLYGGWGLITLALAWAIYAWADLGGLIDFARDLTTQWKDNYQAYQPPKVALTLIGVALPLVIIGATAVGAFRARDAATRLAALWAAVFVALQTFLVAGKETRYFLPALPGIYLLAVAGFAKLPRWLAMGWWLALPAGLVEIARFQDPIFHQAKTEQLALAAAALSETGRVVWVGPFYPLRPRQHLLHRSDDYFSIFHLWANSVAFHLRQQVPTIAFPDSQQVGALRLPRGIAQYLTSGDALVWNQELRSYATHDLPANLAPLLVARVNIHQRSEALPTAGPFEEYAMTGEGLQSLGWRQAFDVPQSEWWLQLQGESVQALNRAERAPDTL